MSFGDGGWAVWSLGGGGLDGWCGGWRVGDQGDC